MDTERVSPLRYPSNCDSKNHFMLKDVAPIHDELVAYWANLIAGAVSFIAPWLGMKEERKIRGGTKTQHFTIVWGRADC